MGDTIYLPSGRAWEGPTKKAAANQGLYRHSRDTNFRKWRPNLSRDLRALMPQWRQKSLVSDSRHVYTATGGTAAGAVHAKANAVAGGAWRYVYTGADSEFKKLAEPLINDWFERCTIMGGPFDFESTVWIASKTIDVDGDFAILPTFAADGKFPKLQFIEGHRIGNRIGQSTVSKAGPLDGLPIVHGVVIDTGGKPLAIQVLGDEPAEDEIISLRRSVLGFDPRWFSQYRGIPSLAYSILDWYDLGEIKEATVIGVKARSKMVLLEQTATGKAPTAKALIDGDELETATAIEDINDGMIKYVKSSSQIQMLDDKRPGDSWEKFYELLQRGALAGLEWPAELIWKMEANGAGARAIVKQARASAKRRQKVLRRPFKRAAIHGVSNFILMGDLPRPADWWKCDFTMPAQLSVDDGNDRRADREDYNLGLKSRRQIVAERYDISYEDFLRGYAEGEKQALEIAAEVGIDPFRMGIRTPNANENFDADKE